VCVSVCVWVCVGAVWVGCGGVGEGVCVCGWGGGGFAGVGARWTCPQLDVFSAA
jgi:hypothetical protein